MHVTITPVPEQVKRIMLTGFVFSNKECTGYATVQSIMNANQVSDITDEQYSMSYL